LRAVVLNRADSSYLPGRRPNDCRKLNAPAEPHWHLQLVGTLPERQGLGLGSALTTHLLAGADQRRELAYLEATTLRSRALYERHGFERQGTITLPDGPTLWQMWRSPR
jgi:ribosomal protein S18 acetylase RimI-like enzyme